MHRSRREGTAATSARRTRLAAGFIAGVLVVAQGSVASAQVRWDAGVLRQAPQWYASDAARAAGDGVLLWQSREGGWPKNQDLLRPPASADALAEVQRRQGNTLDNGATTTPMRFLARVAHATGEDRYREAFARGLDYLLAAQYANGGWPQFFPLRGGYPSRITYNDGAMVGALALLRDAAGGKGEFAFVDPGRRAGAAAAVGRGVDCILKTQVRQGGRLTAWCAQHDEKTLEPAWGRDYEPPSLSGSESVGVVRFLMGIERPTPAVVAAVEGAAAWFEAAAIRGVRVEHFTDAEGRPDRRAVADPSAGPVWARFYELGTGRPVFVGRDKVVRYAFAEIERERRAGYGYYGDWPATLLARDYPDWRARHGRR